MQTRTIEHNDFKLTVSEATTLIGMKRTRLKVEATNAGETDVDRHLLRLYPYSDLVAATVAAEGLPWPLDFESFLALPEQLVAEWEEAVYGLNPHWLPQQSDEQEKKQLTPQSSD